MKSLLPFFFLVVGFSAKAQDSTFRLRAIGIDLFKNVPFAFLSGQNVPLTLVNREPSRFYNPVIAEVYTQFKMPKSLNMLTIGLGYAAIEHRLAQRLRQNIEGYYLKIGHEYRTSINRSIANVFWGYNFTLTRTKVSGLIEIQGQYFPNYTSLIPTDTGFGIGGDLNLGFNFMLFRRIEARFSTRSGIALSDISSPNAIYLPGVGIRTSNKKLALSGGVSIQFFYLLKRLPKQG